MPLETWEDKAKWELYYNDIANAGEENIYLCGVADFRERVLQLLKNNYNLVKSSDTLSEYDTQRMKEIEGIYEDLIKNVENLKPE